MAQQAQAVSVQKGLFDLDTMSEVLLKKVGSFTPVESQHEALSRVGNDTAKFLAVINEGLRSEYQRAFRSDPAGWYTVNEDGEVNGEFVGTIADIKAVNSLVLTLAKTVFGYSKDISPEAKRAAKEGAMEMIKSSDRIREGLKKSAAAILSDEEPDDRYVAM